MADRCIFWPPDTGPHLFIMYFLVHRVGRSFIAICANKRMQNKATCIKRHMRWGAKVQKQSDPSRSARQG
jgi:hypothetical protein